MHTTEATLDVLRPAKLGAAIWHRWTIICGVADKLETIDALKHNIREAIGEI